MLLRRCDMATYTLNEAIKRIDTYIDKVAEEAKVYMSDYIRANADKGYQTGALANSINIEKPSADTRSVGSSLRDEKNGRVYGHYVDKGRGEIKKTDGYMQYYDPKYGKWVKTHHVKAMKGINFIEATANHIKSTNIPL